MPFVQGKCESCGGILTVDPSLKAAICPFCGSAYVVQDSINYYNTTIKVDSLHADVVNVSDETTSEGRLKAADAYMKLGQNDKAEAEYKRVTELTPQNYKGWLGLIEARTKNYKKRNKSAKELKLLAGYAKSVRVFVPDEVEDTVLQKYEEYIKNETEKNTKEINDFNTSIASQTSAWGDLDKKEKSLTNTYNQNQNRVNYLNYNVNIYDQRFREVGRGLLSLGLVITGVLLCFVHPIMGIIPILAAGLPGFLSVYHIIRKKKMKKELETLRSEQEELHAQLNDIVNKKNTYYNAIQYCKRQLMEYI